MEPGSYIVISPVRNEQEHLRDTIDSMAAQTLKPQRWIIVDDGSKDDTAKIALDAGRISPWITLLQRPDRGFRQAGGGVMEAFYEGYRLVGSSRWQFLVKLDG